MYIENLLNDPEITGTVSEKFNKIREKFNENTVFPKAIDSLMNSNFASSVNVPAASFMQTSQLISNTDNSNVVDSIVALQEDVIGLKDAMTNIKMVLDTGTMVGAMTPAIDQELGMRAVYAGRSM